MRNFLKQRLKISQLLVERAHEMLQNGAAASEVKAFMGMMHDDQAAWLGFIKFAAAEREKNQPQVTHSPEEVKAAFAVLFGKEYVQ